MPRAGRVFPPNSVLHIVNRGTERRVLFGGVRDYARFHGLLWRVQSRVPVPLLAYALMPNHWHLVVWPATVRELSQFMHLLTWRHAADFRARTDSVGDGHVYQGRYRARIVDSPQHYLRVVRYVEANALRAGMVKRAQDWRWSSLTERLGKGRAELDIGPVPLPQPDEWLKVVNRGMSADELKDARERR